MTRARTRSPGSVCRTKTHLALVPGDAVPAVRDRADVDLDLVADREAPLPWRLGRRLTRRGGPIAGDRAVEPVLDALGRAPAATARWPP